ncbi:unnamed protein product [Effrenium voratum]|nr:unnamed protein product [Effrenium voratum]
MARSCAVVGVLLAAVVAGSCFLSGVPTQPPRANTAPHHIEALKSAPVQSSESSWSWAAPLLSFGAALGLVFGLVAAQPELVAKGEGSSFKPGFTWGGEFSVPSYRTGGFLGGQEDLFKETNKVFDLGKGAIEMEVNKVNQELGEIGGVFVSKQPSDTDMGAKAPRTILLKGIFYGKVVNA